jgi:hypothetical protein
MRLLLVFLFLLLAGIFLAYPLLVEESGGECSALEQRFVDLASHDSSGSLIVSQLYGSSSSEPSGVAYASDHYPLLPSELGCALAYWKTMVSREIASAPPAAPAPTPAAETPVPQPADQTARANPQLTSVIARDITPNGDPISPGTIFTLPMNAIAIRVDSSAREVGILRFHLLQGRAIISTCLAQRTAAGTAWCKFGIQLRKGAYSISFSANNVLLGQFAFAIIGG